MTVHVEFTVTWLINPMKNWTRFCAIVSSIYGHNANDWYDIVNIPGVSSFLTVVNSLCLDRKIVFECYGKGLNTR